MALTSLPLFHRIAGERVVVVGDGAAADARRRLVERAGGVPCTEHEAHHARLAFIALAEDQEAPAIALRLKRRGLLVNVTDRPDLCDFTVPSLLEREPVLVAVGTSGASAGLAKQLRLRLEALLPESLGSLASALHGARAAIRARWPDATARRHAIDAALAEGGALDPLREHDSSALASWLENPDAPAPRQTIEIVLASDNPDDLTLRDARLLGEADWVLHDRGVGDAILARARADAVRRFLPCDTPGEGLVVILRLP